MVSDFGAGLSALEERLNELPDVDPAAQPVTLPPQAARQVPIWRSSARSDDAAMASLVRSICQDRARRCWSDDLADDEVLSALPIEDAQ